MLQFLWKIYSPYLQCSLPIAFSRQNWHLQDLNLKPKEYFELSLVLRISSHTSIWFIRSCSFYKTAYPVCIYFGHKSYVCALKDGGRMLAEIYSAFNGFDRCYIKSVILTSKNNSFVFGKASFTFWRIMIHRFMGDLHSYQKWENKKSIL